MVRYIISDEVHVAENRTDVTVLRKWVNVLHLGLLHGLIIIIGCLLYFLMTGSSPETYNTIK